MEKIMKFIKAQPMLAIAFAATLITMFIATEPYLFSFSA